MSAIIRTVVVSVQLAAVFSIAVATCVILHTLTRPRNPDPSQDDGKKKDQSTAASTPTTPGGRPKSWMPVGLGLGSRDRRPQPQPVNIDLSRLQKFLNKEQKAVIEIVADSLKQLDGEIVIPPEGHSISTVDPKAEASSTSLLATDDVDTAASERAGADGKSISSSSVTSLFKRKRKEKKGDDPASPRASSDNVSQIFRGVHSFSSEPLPPQGQDEDSVSVSSSGSVANPGPVSSYATYTPRLSLHTHSQNPVHRLEKCKMPQDKATQFIAEVVCGEVCAHVISDIAQWPRHISCRWAANGQVVACQLTDWSFTPSKSDPDQWDAIPFKGTVGTAWRRLLDTEPSTHLMNVYSTHVADTHTVVRSGIIDTPKKVLQWKATIQAVIKERTDAAIPLDPATGLTRVVSLSLVSTSSLAGDEKTMAMQQHTIIYDHVGPRSSLRSWKIKRQTTQEIKPESPPGSPDSLRSLTAAIKKDSVASVDPGLAASDGIDIVHVNYQTNVNEIGSIAVGEKASRKINGKGLLRYCSWLATDVASFLATLPADLPEVKAGQEAVSGLDSVLPKIKELAEQTYWEVDRDVVRRLQAMLDALKPLQTVVPADVAGQGWRDLIRAALRTSKPTPPPAMRLRDLVCACRAMLHLLQAHRSESYNLSRVQELLLLSITNCALDIVTAINCKSGCDRTGLVFGLMCATAMVWETRPGEREALLDMAESFDAIYQKHEGVYSKGLDAWTAYVQELESDPVANRLQLLACELRNCVLVNMMEVGWKIILYSTGLPGFKFGAERALLKNPHVTPLLPPFILSPDGLHMNRDFRDFFIGASSYRGGAHPDDK
eukprot:comp24122_c0_seq2/m.43742 comp24122_c0_seq2/g.43742  ORF comp24122_c0_seq2/g.43742 comp24122_c0_seq2/m.43742 type:complete len:832 (-) comp24122_c0_seq2:456-2951(-)